MGILRGIVVIALILTGPGGVTAREDLPPAVAPCSSCHPGQAAVLAGPMATRSAEVAFACRAFGDEGPAFFSASCAGCHVSACEDCHAGDAHRPATAYDSACLECHKGYFTGWDYFGRAPREDHGRFQRGPEAQGEYHLAMAPDIHAAAGLGCADCHRIHGAPEAEARGCRDCHLEIDETVPEHAIVAHLDHMTCSACHAAWAAQEYGTTLVMPRGEAAEDAFWSLPEAGDWIKSAALRQQGPPPLGLDSAGRVSPIRPQFILLATDRHRDWENRLLVAEWKAFAPHTIRRGSVTCGGCHENPRRFLLEDPADRIYDLGADGLPLESWWSRTGQRVVNGEFFPAERFERMNRRTPEYVRQHLRRWQSMIETGAASSAR